MVMYGKPFIPNKIITLLEINTLTVRYILNTTMRCRCGTRNTQTQRTACLYASVTCKISSPPGIWGYFYRFIVFCAELVDQRSTWIDLGEIRV